MIQIYADDVLAYDSRLDEYKLLNLNTTEGLNKAGTATIVMPPNHPAFDFFVSYRTVVTIYEDGALAFRGRALRPADDFYSRRTITCEGERGFFRDGVARPYLYQATPEEIFADLVNTYNSQVESWKQFKVGTVTVTDPNNYVRLENTSASRISEALDKLVERCGGYIVFTTDADGDRVVNWYAELGYRSGQSIEFGKNLLDFTRGENDTELATCILPYGAEDEETGERVTITGLNDGLDYIEDAEAVALRGHIFEAVYWDDVTEPLNLLTKAQQYLADRKNVITGLQLTAVDLHALDKNINAFQLGDLVRVTSRPHGVDEDFLLTERSRDWFAADGGSISLGKEQASLTGLDTAGDRESASQLQKTEHNIRAEYNKSIAAAVQETKQMLTSLIEQTSEAIRLEVSETYQTGDEVVKLISSSMEQLSDSFTFRFTELEAAVDANDASAREQFKTIEKYIRFDGGDIILGETGNEVTLRIENDRISFLQNGGEVAYFSNNKLTVTDGHFLTTLRIGSFAFLPRENGNLSLIKVVD